jgi:glycosyltransferase involved in cell wall biosynthesis
MRIAWLHSHFHHPTGGTKYVFGLLAKLAADHEVTVIVEDAPEQICADFRRLGIKVEVLLGTSSYAPSYWAGFPLQLSRVVSKLRAMKDAFDAWVPSMFPMHIALHRAGISNMGIFCFEPFPFFYDTRMVAGQPIHVRTYFKLMRSAMQAEDLEVHRQARGVLTTTAGVNPFIRDVYGVDAVPISLGVDVERFRPPAGGVKPGQVLHTTDYSPLKNTDDLVEAIPGIVRRVPEASFVISHTIEQRAVIELYQRKLSAAGCADRVRFAGRLSEDELLRCYQESALGVYLGSGYGAAANSLFVLELMACGKPIVRSSTVDTEVVDGKTGRLFAPHDIAAFEKAVAALLMDDALRLTMGENARRQIVEDYSWDRVRDNFEVFLKEKF